MDGWINWWINGRMDGWMDWSNDLWIDGLMNLPPSKGHFQRGLSLLRIRIGCPTGILVFFGMEEFGANLAVPIGTTSCKCRRKRSFLFYAFLWTCQETVKFQALKILVGEVKSVSWGDARTKAEVHKRERTNTMFLHSGFLTSLTSSLTALLLRLENLRCELLT